MGEQSTQFMAVSVLQLVLLWVKRTWCLSQEPTFVIGLKITKSDKKKSHGRQTELEPREPVHTGRTSYSSYEP